MNVKFGEQGGLLHVIDEFWDEGEWIGISDGVGVQIVVILAWAKSSILLWYKEEGGGLGGFEGTICPVLRCSLTKDLHVSILVGLRE